MNAISPLRFDALAGYSREPQSVLVSEELGWFEEANERVLGVLARDTSDDDFVGCVLARDRKGRYRAVTLTAFYPTPELAVEALATTMKNVAGWKDEEYHQHDEKGTAIDLFTPVVPVERLHPSFRTIAFEPAYAPARGIIQAMSSYFDDADRNFVEQFQTTGFDARTWELYLFAALVELNYKIDRSGAVPDFVCSGLPGDFAVEASTVNPTIKDGAVADPQPNTQEELASFLRDYMPIKFGSVLTTKLRKRYWESQRVAGKPLLFAVQDFHQMRSMVWTASALPTYLYGIEQTTLFSADGKLQVKTHAVTEHVWGAKRIESGFFNLPDAENVSAVLFNSGGTITKFNRMGWLADFGPRDLQMIRSGIAVNHDPNANKPLEFRFRVSDPGYDETWTEGMSVFHNPRALQPLPEEWFPGVAHHYFRDGVFVSHVPTFHPLSSVTAIVTRSDTAHG